MIHAADAHLLLGPVRRVDGIVERAGRNTALRVRQYRVRVDVGDRVGEELSDLGRPVLELQHGSRDEPPEPVEPHRAVEGDQVGHRLSVARGLCDDVAVAIDHSQDETIGTIGPPRQDAYRLVLLEGVGHRRAVGDRSVALVAKGQVEGACARVVGDLRSPPGRSGRRHDAEQHRIVRRPTERIEVGVPLHAEPRRLAQLRSPECRELVQSILHRLVRHIPTTDTHAPLGVVVGVRRHRDRRDAPTGDRLVVGVVDVQMLTGMDRVDINLIHRLRLTVRGTHVQVAADHRAGVRHRSRLPVGCRVVVDRLGGVPVLDVLRDDVAEDVLLILQVLHALVALVDVALDEQVHQADRIGPLGHRRIGGTHHPDLDGLRHDGIDGGVVLIPTRRGRRGARYVECQRNSLSVAHLEPVVRSVLIPELHPAGLASDLDTDFRNRQGQLVIHAHSFHRRVSGDARLREPLPSTGGDRRDRVLRVEALEVEQVDDEIAQAQREVELEVETGHGTNPKFSPTPRHGRSVTGERLPWKGELDVHAFVTVESFVGGFQATARSGVKTFFDVEVAMIGSR